MRMFEVGGCVRDEILGLPSKDIDFSVVLEDNWIDTSAGLQSNGDPFKCMVIRLSARGFKIFLETPEHFTVRAQFPNYMPHREGYERRNLTADFVLARIEGPYTDGRRPDWVKPGTLEDDLARRDFTMNAIAKDADGSYIDPFNGRGDIERRLIRAVGDPAERLREDALRALRAIRFSVTKGFRIEGELLNVIHFDTEIHDLLVNKISDERKKDELNKMLHFDSFETLKQLAAFPTLTACIFSGTVSLDATMKTKGRGRK